MYVSTLVNFKVFILLLVVYSLIREEKNLEKNV